MTCESDVARRVLRSLGICDSAGEVVSTDGIVLSPMGGSSKGNHETACVNRLIAAGLIRRTNDFHMRPPPDPVTLRATSDGHVWVRRAFDDGEWASALPELQRLLSQTTGT